MKIRDHRFGGFLPVALGSAMLGLSGSVAQAATVVCATFCVDEYFNASLNVGYYNVTNNSSSESVVAFAVANDTAVSASGMTELQGEWNAGIIQAADWNSSKTQFETAYSMTIPLFEDAFSGYSQALVYWAVDLLPPAEAATINALPWTQLDTGYWTPPLAVSLPVLPGTSSGDGTEGWSFLAASAASPFLVLSVDTVTGDFNLTGGETILTTVPLPASLWMFAAGFGAVARWKRARTA